jgi:crotonobetainyl-CoA:carnitine CoA-transferase CaiB-like acyl-CoA transferase
MASYLLRESGSQVVKVENPKGGDGLRTSGAKIAGTGRFHAALNAGALSIAVDTRSAEWPEVVAACARWADAVIVGARPEDARRRGIDFESLRAIRPDVVYCSISGYGDHGPWRGYAAHGQNADAMAGNVPVEWHDGMPTTPAGWRSAGTTLAGVFSALGILAALYRREVSGGAQFVPVSMWQCATWWNWRDVNMLANTGEGSWEYQSMGSRYSMYPAGDDRALVVCPIEEKFWVGFCDLLGLPESWRKRGTWARTRTDYGYEDEREDIARVLRTRPLSEWIARLDAAGIPFAPVLTIPEVIASEHAEANGLMRSVPVGDQVASVLAAPYRVLSGPEDGLTPRPLGEPPAIGEQTVEILRELGLADLARRFSSKTN